MDSANSAISIYHEYLTIQYSLSLSLSLCLCLCLCGKTLHKLSQCTLGICYLSLSVDGAPEEPQHNNIKLCFPDCHRLSWSKQVCTSLCLQVHRGHYNIPQNMVFPTVISSRPWGHATCVMERNFAVSSISMYTPVSSIVLRVFGWLVG